MRLGPAIYVLYEGYRYYDHADDHGEEDQGGDGSRCDLIPLSSPGPERIAFVSSLVALCQRAPVVFTWKRGDEARVCEELGRR